MIRDLGWLIKALWSLWRRPPGLKFLFDELPDELWPDPDEEEETCT